MVMIDNLKNDDSLLLKKNPYIVSVNLAMKQTWQECRLLLRHDLRAFWLNKGDQSEAAS